jgi:hypothetical protein
MAKATERIASDVLAAGREHLADAEWGAARKRMARTDHIQRAGRSQSGEAGAARRHALLMGAERRPLRRWGR